ncbi:gamma-glutamylcyclotransferase [Brevibacillus centrosporus]|uniref:gamma-glutamylcyclotransferase family protein n=1 Tax=Brevibacillus centrosporus TaxID=54910 RepID=UPI002E209762|nr:gamma-glutamylcyclotransferase [Brevibacillus centrosporus]
MSKTMPVFVYGTLLEGFMNHALYAKPYDCEVQPAKIKGEVYHLPQGYPGLLAGNDDVIGEILLFSPEVFEKAISALDELETYFGPEDSRNEYERIEVSAVLVQTGEEVIAYVYRYLDAEYVKQWGTRIQDGDWRRYMLDVLAE